MAEPSRCGQVRAAMRELEEGGQVLRVKVRTKVDLVNWSVPEADSPACRSTGLAALGRDLRS